MSRVIERQSPLFVQFIETGIDVVINSPVLGPLNAARLRFSDIHYRYSTNSLRRLGGEARQGLPVSV